MKTHSENYNTSETDIGELISGISTPLESSADLDPLIKEIGDSQYVLLGEASHGTHEYYTWRAKISQRLIKEKGFSFIAVEGDWPDCYRLNRYVKNYPGTGESAKEVLQAFNRWPTWMWANWEIVAFAEWLKSYNENLSAERRVGFYGLDMYSLYESLEFIMEYLKINDPIALKKAEKAVRCFEPYWRDEGRSYARASSLVPELCEKEVVDLLSEIHGKVAQYNSDHENVFSTEQNALVAMNAEKYYRAMIKGGAESWNIRDRHMVTTLNRLKDFYGKNSKVIVWEHNTHIGDARATDMTREGMVNVGELVAKEHSEEGVFSVGFGSYKGTVIAGREWGDEIRKMHVPSAMENSWEEILHDSGNGKNKLVMLHKIKHKKQLDMRIGHRAIGVVYHPELEQYGNYVPSVLPMRYSAFIFIDETKALHPLHIEPDGHQIPETFPFGV
ncbi:MAG: erythromycin esterase family protein [Bacteroidia bacterium]